MPHPTRVLFVSDGNATRSPMAEALLKRLGGAGFEVHSAGFEPQPLHPLAVQAMQEIGIDISAQASRHVNDFLETQFDYSVILCDRDMHFSPDYPHDHVNLHWACDDPTAVGGSESERLNAFRQTRDELRARLESWVASLPKRGA
jgi:arsenate reductase